MKNIDRNSKEYERLEAADKAIHREADLIQQLLTFAEGEALNRKPTNIAGAVRESADFALKGSNIKCVYKMEDPLWPVEVDEGQISKVIRNLVINARQNMPEEGIIQVSAENTIMRSGADEAPQNVKYVKVSVQDQGTGISREDLQKIFDPYFSTHEMGRGLGLAVAYSIIKRHDGHISVESELQKGSAFSIYLPASEKRTEKKGPGC